MLYTIIGGKVADIEKKVASTGKTWGFLRLAETSDFKDKDGNKVTSYYSIPVFGEALIDMVNNAVDKGGRLMVTGQADLVKKDDKLSFDSRMCSVKILDFKKKDKQENETTSDEDSEDFPF